MCLHFDLKLPLKMLQYHTGLADVVGINIYGMYILYRPYSYHIRPYLHGPSGQRQPVRFMSHFTNITHCLSVSTWHFDRMTCAENPRFFHGVPMQSPGTMCLTCVSWKTSWSGWTVCLKLFTRIPNPNHNPTQTTHWDSWKTLDCWDWFQDPIKFSSVSFKRLAKSVSMIPNGPLPMPKYLKVFQRFH